MKPLSFKKTILKLSSFLLSACICFSSVSMVKASDSDTEKVFKGDLDKNNLIDESDSTLMKERLLLLREFTIIDESRADIDNDDKITSTDYLLLKARILSIFNFSNRGLWNGEDLSIYTKTPSDEIIDEIKKTYLEAVCKGACKKEEVKIYYTYGPFDGAYAVGISCERHMQFANDAITGYTVAGFNFVHGSSATYYFYKDGKYVDLLKSYYSGIMTKSGLEKLYKLHYSHSIYKEYVTNESHAVLYVSLPTLETEQGYKTFQAYFDGSIEGLVEALEKGEKLPKGTKVNSFTIEGGISCDTARIDLSKEFENGLGLSEEQDVLYVGNLCNSIINYFGVDKVYLTVNGKTIETKFKTYTEPEEYKLGTIIYFPAEELLHFEKEAVYYNGKTENVIEILEEKGIVPKGTKFNYMGFDFDLQSTRIDLSKEFGVGLSKLSDLEAKKIMYAVANSVLKSYTTHDLSFSVDGEVLKIDGTTKLYAKEAIYAYAPDFSKKTLVKKELTFNRRISDLISAMEKEGIIPTGSSYNSFNIKDNVAKIGLSKEFGVGLKTAYTKDKTQEKLIVGALVNTIIEYYGVEKVSFTVEKQIYETDDGRYNEPLGFFTFE